MTHLHITKSLPAVLSGIGAGFAISFIAGFIVTQFQMTAFAPMSWGFPIAIFLAAIVAAVRMRAEERSFFIAFSIAFVCFPVMVGVALTLLINSGCC